MFFFLSLIKNYYSILIKSHKPAIIGIESAKNDKNVESFSKIIKVSTLLNESSFILCFFLFILNVIKLYTLRKHIVFKNFRN
jgi:hypothetical protein